MVHFTHTSFSVAWLGMPDLSQLQRFKQRVPFCSQSALEGILDLASKEGIPESHKRKQIRQSVEQTIEALNTYGPLLVAATAMTLAEGPMDIVFANIFSYIAGAYAAGGCFATFLEEVHSNNPSGYNTPWHCVLYADEIHPGNQLAGSSRKSWALYFSFAEFGPMLSNSEAWFTIFVMRSDLVGKLAANIGQIYRLVLEHMFDNKQAHPHAGVLLHRGAARMKLFWTMGFFIQDGSAQKFTFSNKQDSGSRICMACKNIIVLTRDEEKGDKEIAKFTKYSQLDIANDQEILGSWDRMKSRKSLSKAEFKRWSQACGIDYHEQALLLSPTLRQQNLLKPITQYMHDYMHGLCSNGVMSWIAFLLIQSLHSNGVDDIWEHLHGYVQLWNQPAIHKTDLGKLFTAKAVKGHKEANKFKCSASEMLSLYKVLARYVHTCCLANGLCVLASQCYLAWCSVLDYCVAIPALATPDHKQLLAVVEKALDATVQAGWSEEFKPKMHWVLHTSDSLKKHGQLVACWSMERRHKTIRKHGSLLTNTTHWETSLTKAVIAEHFHLLGEETDLFRKGFYLENMRKPSQKMLASLCKHGLVPAGGTCMHSRSCRLASGATITCGDVLLLAEGKTPPFTAAQVHGFFNLDSGNANVALVEKYKLNDWRPAQMCSTWLVSSPRSFCLVILEEILCAVTYSFAKGKVTCLTPPFLQLCNENVKCLSDWEFTWLTKPNGLYNLWHVFFTSLQGLLFLGKPARAFVFWQACKGFYFF